MNDPLENLKEPVTKKEKLRNNKIHESIRYLKRIHETPLHELSDDEWWYVMTGQKPND